MPIQLLILFLEDQELAVAEGDARGVRFARSMARFFAELDSVVPNASQRLALYQHLNELDTMTNQLNVMWLLQKW